MGERLGVEVENVCRLGVVKLRVGGDRVEAVRDGVECAGWR